MLKNYLKIALRNLLRHKVFSLINILGLAIGMACCLLILEFVFFELSYDKFHEGRDKLYKVYSQHYLNGKPATKGSHTSHGLGPVMKKDFPEVEDYARITWAGSLIKYVKGADLSPRPVEFTLKGYENADTVSVVGSFNQWKSDQNPMEKVAGIWKTSIDLHPDSYEYKIYVDGEYLVDVENPDTIHTYGNINSIKRVKPLKEGEKEVLVDVDHNYHADASLFSMFSFPLISGDYKALEEPNTVLISEETSKKIFGPESALDKLITVNGNEQYIVKGVFKEIPENSHFKFNMIFSFQNVLQRDMYKDPWEWDNFTTYIKLKKDANLSKLEAGFAKINEKYFPGTIEKGHLHSFPLIPVEKIHLHSDAEGDMENGGSYKRILFLSLIVLLILVIAYVNYINLTTVRSMDRAREIGVRKVSGAHKNSLVRQFLLESLLLSLLGFIAGLLIVFLAQPFFNDLVGKQLNLWNIDNIFFWGMIFLVLIAGALLSGLYPALLISSFKPVTALKGRVKTSSGLLLRKGLVVAQFAASIALISGTFAVHQQIKFMQEQELGFDDEQVLILNAPQGPTSAFDSKLKTFRSELLRHPSIEGLSASSSIPSKGISWGTNDVRRSTDPISVSNDFEFYWIDDEFIPLYGLEMVAGKKFTKDLSIEENGIILTETACKKFGFNTPEEALNATIIMEKNQAKVLGVVKDYHHSSLKDNFRPFILIYFPYVKGYFSIKVKPSNIKQTIASIEDKYEQVFPGNPANFYFLDEEFNKQYQQEINFGKIFGLFTTLAIIIACLGLFGLASFSILQRTKEIGIRKVLGASISNLVLLLTKDFVKLIIIATFIALPVAYFMISNWLENYPFRISINWWMLGAPALLVLIIALVTISFQTVKTAVENPVKALKSE